MEAINSAKGLSKRQKHMNLVIDYFWKRWRRKYLTELREHHHGRKESEKRRVQEGDVVCVHEDLTSRQNWKVGVVQKLIPGRDGRVRGGVCTFGQWREVRGVSSTCGKIVSSSSSEGQS